MAPEEPEKNHKLLSERTSLLQVIIDNFPGGIAYYDKDLRVAVCNDKAKAILDLPERFFVNGPPRYEDILRFNAERGEYGPGDVEAHVARRLAIVAARQPYRNEQRMRRDGTVLDVIGHPIEDGGFITTYMDITERYLAETRIAHMAYHDELTDLPNRLLLRERLGELLLNNGHRRQTVAVLSLDLDRFKEVNDARGHAIGDALLKSVADRLRSCVRETDLVSRLGGDEFTVVHISADPPREAAALANRIIEAMTIPFHVQGHRLLIGTSIGIAIAPSDGSDIEQILKSSDLALYGAKSDGRGTYCFFEPEMNTRMQARYALEMDLREALEREQLELHYQPVVNLRTDQVCGCEALLRWQHPQRGRISPADFIPIAEATGLIVPIGEWVLRQACGEAATWPAGVKVAVNLSACQFKTNLVQIVVSALASSGLAPNRLELEITESVLLSDSDRTLATLRQLHDLGVQVALDDFGTGYSSLGYLRSFPFDKIKIDRCFISDLSQETPDAIAILRAVTQLGRDLGMSTTAEGVETAEQLSVIRAEGCTEMQGYLFSPPVAATALPRFFPVQSKRSASAA